MKIGIDARLIDETGVGRYIRNLVTELARIDTTNEYVLFLADPQFSSYELPNARWSKVRANVRWHTVSEQVALPGIFNGQHLDLLHVPYHNPPIFYPGKMVVTIHDLTILHFSTGKATTLPKPLYHLKRWGYRLELAIGLQKAAHILTVSNATKREIMDHFHVPQGKISVIYEGVDPKLGQVKNRNSDGVVTGPYFLVVGNAYPHKNLEKLLEGYATYRKNTAHPADLVLVGKNDYFYKQLKAFAQSLGIGTGLIFYGAANDAELISLYSHATAFFFPSLMEGFGLPALEALSFNTPVVVSNISVFHEILGEFATYIDPADAGDMARAFERAASGKLPKPDVKALAEFLSQYSWRHLAKETLSLYERCARV